jgi:hypothetical protein
MERRMRLDNPIRAAAHCPINFCIRVGSAQSRKQRRRKDHIPDAARFQNQEPIQCDLAYNFSMKRKV